MTRRATTQIAPMLAVSDPKAAIAFYVRAFGAEINWTIGPDDDPQVAGLQVDGAEFFLAKHGPPRTTGPDVAGTTSVRIELFVDDPAAVQRRAVDAGGVSGDPVQERRHPIAGGGEIHMLQGGVVDPFGHIWLIGRFL